MLQQLLGLHSLCKPIKIPHTYTPLAGALSSWIPIGRAGCPGDKGRHLCWAGAVYGHKESGQQAMDMPGCSAHSTILPRPSFAAPVPSLHHTCSPLALALADPRGSSGIRATTHAVSHGGQCRKHACEAGVSSAVFPLRASQQTSSTTLLRLG